MHSSNVDLNAGKAFVYRFEGYFADEEMPRGSSIRQEKCLQKLD